MHLGYYIFVLFLFSETQSTAVLEVEGDPAIAVLVEDCRNESEVIPFRKQALVSTAVWTTERVNFLEYLAPMKLGLKVFEICTEAEYFKSVFDLYNQNETFILGIVTEKKLNDRLVKFGDLLDLRTIPVPHQYGFLIKAAIKLLSALGWVENVTILAPEETITSEFYKHSKSSFICIKECIIYEHTCPVTFNNSATYTFFGNIKQIEEFIKFQEYSESDEVDAIFVPLDGSVPTGLPESSFVIIPPHHPASTKYKTRENILPSPMFLSTAKSILTFSKNIEKYVEKNCNDTSYKVNCLRSKFNRKYRPVLMSPNGILDILKIEPLTSNFVYDIYRVENDTSNISVLALRNNFLQPYTKIFSYNIFYDNITLVDQSFEDRSPNASINEATSNCLNYFKEKRFTFFIDNISNLSFRSEAWVYAFLSLSLLGVIFCMSIIIFLLICICRRDILEGNPILTISLLVAVMILFCSVLPFSLQDNSTTKNPLCLAKSLSITLGYAMVFSLLLSRCILLATACKEIGFLSHIAGPVQSFLCLFIFGVQAALSLQIIGKCQEVFFRQSFIYLLSYNIMLLLLLLCLCPLIFKCERNYREGKYFCIAIISITIVWLIWLPIYMFYDEGWTEPMLCLGLVGTAGVFLGAIFIPRTYLMTIAAARNKITSTLPSLNTANSIVDIYRSNTQPIYDCVNVAAINAVNVARAGVTLSGQQVMQQPDLYTCPALPDDEDLDFRCDSPTSNDKITRF
ncbi:protein bride of sevenless [Diabrotica virgifera virgifera]|uniref:G-protein coupled receptors family 3 profile domain-containing protein n=1 Tax=Diabrotica virgifera virgifera TaxID=50390 RepID=A0ABM5JP04_DIAVI|nr:protein bride of sevenless [Diabrotica virgifera virgifera]